LRLRPLLRSEHRCDESLCPTHSSLLLLLVLHLNDTFPSLLRRDSRPANELNLSLTHSRVDVDVLDFDVERAMLLTHEPRPTLPAKVQNKKEGACMIVLEEDGGVEIGPADGPKGDVELGG